MRPNSPRTSHRTHLYLTAKTQAQQLTRSASLFTPDQLPHYLQQCQNIINKVQNGSDRQKGQICLLLCQSAVIMGVRVVRLPLGKGFAGVVAKYLASFLEVASGTTRQWSRNKGQVNQIYTHRYRSPAKELQFQTGQSKLKDHFLIDRYDELLLNVFTQLHQEGLGLFCRMPKILVSFMLSTVATAFRYLGQTEANKYKDNIEGLVSLCRQQKKQKSHYSAPKAYVLIDKNTIISQTFSFHKKIASNKKNSSEHRTSSQMMRISIDEVDSKQRQPNEVQPFKMTAKAVRSMKRGSASSSFSKRTSNMKEPGTVTVSSNLKSSSNRNKPMRSSMNFINKLSTVQGRLQRRSRFQLISKLESQALKNQFQSEPKDNDSQSDQLELKMKKKTSRAYSYKQQTQVFAFRPFYLFSEVSGQVEVWLVEHQKGENDVEGIYFEPPRLKIINQLRNYCIFMVPEIDTSCNETIEEECQQYLSQMTRIIKRGHKMILEKLAIPSKDMHYSPFLSTQAQKQQILMGFIRKISNYFLQISHYKLQPLQKHYHNGIKKDLLTPHSPLPFEMTIQNKLMNCELTMSFQAEQKEIFKTGSIIKYIQNQEDLPDVSPFSNQTYKLSLEYCTLRQSEEVYFRSVWIKSDRYLYDYGPKRVKKGRRNNNSKMSRTIVNDQAPRKLRRIAQNKSSSIRVQASEIDMLRVDSQFSKMSKMHSRRDMTSDKRVRTDYVMPMLKTKAKMAENKKTISFVETIMTQKGYRLVRRTAKEQIDGYHLNQYQGYLCRSPQSIRFWKDKQQNQPYYETSRSNLTVHNYHQTKVQSSQLITFIKPLRNQRSSIGYLVSSIKILTLSANHSIFIESYSDKMQKYFIFTISSELFSKITEINTDSFWQKTYVRQQKKPKKHQRPSVLFSIRQRSGTDQSVKNQNNETHKSKLIRQASLQSNSYNQHDQTRSKFKEKKVINSAKMNKLDISNKSQMNSKVKNSCSQKEGLVTHIKNKLIKYISFEWKNHTLKLIITVNSSTGLQLHKNKNYVFEGRELAAKNIHQSKSDPQIASATELILVKYQERNLTNLNCFTHQGLNKISLEHIFIKNNDSLYSRYYDILNLSILPYESRVHNYYLANNNFFQTKISNDNPKKATKLKKTLTKVSTRQDQKRFKYVQIINFAKQCIIPFSFVQSKRKNYTRKSFIVPNRYPLLQQDDQILLCIHMRNTGMAVQRMNGQNVISFTFDRLQPYFPQIRALGVSQKRDILLKRVLVDEDLVRLCTY